MTYLNSEYWIDSSFSAIIGIKECANYHVIIDHPLMKKNVTLLSSKNLTVVHGGT